MKTTPDGRYSLVTEECLACCDHAPCMIINEKVHKRVRPEDVARILDDPDNDKLAVPRSDLLDAPTPRRRMTPPEPRQPLDMSHRQRAILLTLLAAQLALRIAIVAYNGPLTDQDLYGDDAFICHKLAMNIAHGAGITQAGEPTNGFQPLFVFLLAPVFLVLDAYPATIASALLNTVFSALGSLLLFAILRRLASLRAGFVGVVLWTASPYLTRVSLNGMETALANMLMLLVVHAHLRSMTPTGRWTLGTGGLLGAIMGLAILARFDLGLLVLTAGGDQVRVRIRRRELGPLVMTMAVGACCLAPWFAWSYTVCGSLTPVSGEASRTISQLYGHPRGPQRHPTYFPLGEVPGWFYADNVQQAARTVLVESPLAIPARTLGSTGVIGSLACLAAWALAAWVLPQRRARNANNGTGGTAPFGQVAGTDPWRSLRFLWAFLPLLVGAYCFYFFAQWHFWRYLSPVVIALMLPSAVMVDRVLFARAASRTGGRAFAGLAVVVYLGIGGWGHARWFRPPDHGIAYNIYHDTMDLKPMLTPDMRIGSFESGTLDYFLDVDVINLDDKTNELAHREMVAGRMDRLVETLRLDYIVSSPPLIRDLLVARGRWAPESFTQLKRLSHSVVLKMERGAAPGSVERGG